MGERLSVRASDGRDGWTSRSGFAVAEPSSQSKGYPHMTVTAERSTDATAIRPFTIETPEADLDDLRARIAATRWPEKEGVDDASQGVQLATIQAVARYWHDEYDWRKCEARLNAVPQFVTEIDGLDIHFVHVRSKHEERCRLSSATDGRARSSSR